MKPTLITFTLQVANCDPKTINFLRGIGALFSDPKLQRIAKSIKKGNLIIQMQVETGNVRVCAPSDFKHFNSPPYLSKLTPNQRN